MKASIRYSDHGILGDRFSSAVYKRWKEEVPWHYNDYWKQTICLAWQSDLVSLVIDYEEAVKLRERFGA